MKVSVIMIDGSFRENTFGAEYFSEQDFPNEDFEVIWVEFYKSANKDLKNHKQLKIISLGNSADTIYHSSYCFNEGIRQAQGELLIIPDADVLVETDFVQRAWDLHQAHQKLVVYGYRYNEIPENKLNKLSFDELKEKCVITNPTNYGGCITVRKKWMIDINGYDKTEIFQSGFHANGKDIYTRFRHFGMAIQWEPSLKLYHPLHSFTSKKAPEYLRQRKLIDWRNKNLEYLPLKGLDSNKNARDVYIEEVIENKSNSKTKLNRIQQLKHLLPFLKKF